jgi:hypothetical protein
MITPHDLKLAEATAAQMTEEQQFNQGREFLDRMQTHPCETCRFHEASSIRPDLDSCNHPNAKKSECHSRRWQRLLTAKMGFCSKAGQWWEGKV